MDISDHVRLYLLCGSLGWLIGNADGVASAFIGASLTLSALSFWSEWLDHRARKRQIAEYDRMSAELHEKMAASMAKYKTPDLGDIHV